MPTDSPIVDDCLEPPRREGELGRLGPYRIVGLLGRGGMGRVYQARDSRLQRTVALKLMNERFAAAVHGRQRFLEEARAMAAVHHDNVATVFEVGERSGTRFLAMELLRGKTLAELNASGRRWTVDEILRLATQVTRGLAAAHQVGIVHRDIKPANLWIQSPGERVKILDFGLALAGTGTDHLTAGGTVVGTPGFLSPEQARNEPVDDRTDLYGLGVVLYELCTGRLPLLSKTVVGQLIAIIAHEPKPVRELNRDIPIPLADLVHRLLAKEPRERPRSAVALERELEEVARACEAERTAALQIVTDPLPASTGADEPAGSKASIGRRPSWLPWAISAAALVIAGPLLWWSLRAPGPGAAEASARGSRSVSPPQVAVLASKLAPLALTEVLAGSPRVQQGEAARFRVSLTNTAADRGNDPRAVLERAPVAAQVVCYLQRPGRLPRKAPAFPKRLSPTQLPRPGETSEVEVQFLTTGLARNDYEVRFELQSPAGAEVSAVATRLTVEENLRQGDLLGFEMLRTHIGRGADSYVRTTGKASDLGSQPVIQVHRRGPKLREHAYLRFDLSQSPVAPERIDRAVLCLTVGDGGHQGRSTLSAYGVSGSDAITADWQEHGDSPLRWEDSPSAQGLGRLTYLGQVTIENARGALKGKLDQVRIVGPNLDEFLRRCLEPTVTIVLERDNGAEKPTRFSAKEGRPEQAPALALRSRRDEVQP